ncbi:MAG TPA: electron transfer flavoprotein subunit beta/FixA family protein [Thermoplasmata archaeon]|nr:electron transfer flavoprotein subunit beta/FixA family protein [Thermoplasmata archaeon]
MPLNVIVCLKQIPNPDLQFQVSADGKDIKRDMLTYKVNGPDEYALEEAVRLKEKHGGKVTAITAGPKRTEPMLREAMAKGADAAVRIAFEDAAAVDAFQVARILAAAIAKRPHDLVLTGVQSDDYVYSATGPLLAGFLGIPHASVVTKVEVQETAVKVWREIEGGDQEVVSVPRPALLTIQFGINQPRYAPLPAIMKASRQPIEEAKPADLGESSWDAFRGPYTIAVRKVMLPAAKGHAEMIPGKVAEQAKAVAQLLREKGLFRG